MIGVIGMNGMIGVIGVIEVRVNGVDIETFVTRRERIVDILDAIVNRGEVGGR